MRVLEWLIIVVDLWFILSTWRPALKRQHKPLAFLAGIGALLIVAHLLFEGYRWQMWPIYGVTGGLILAVLYTPSDRPRGQGRRVGNIFGLIGLLIGTALAILLPVPKFPRPTGPYAIGTITYHWIDTSRTATYGDDPGAPRELMAQVWYPAEKPRGQRPARWLDGGMAVSRAMAEWSGFPRFLIDQTALARTHAYEGTPLTAAEAIYPVVIYVHGWGGFRNINQDQIEALASHGYVVISADHTYGALITLFPDGRIAPNDTRALREDGSEAEAVQASNALMKVFAADAQFILDQMVQLNAVDPEGRFTGRLDVERVGFFGHSTGGGGIVYACAIDTRCKAVFGQDAWVEPVVEEAIAHGFSQPLLLVNSATWRDGKNVPSQRQLYAALQDARYFLSIDDTQHYDFVAVPTFSPLAPLLGVKGPLPARRVMEINEVYLVAFFDKHLLSQPVSLLGGPSHDYPEVQFEVR
jgi:predicted dienelactone hydrolase